LIQDAGPEFSIAAFFDDETLVSQDSLLAGVAGLPELLIDLAERGEEFKVQQCK
jgi:hypothetical protein